VLPEAPGPFCPLLEMGLIASFRRIRGEKAKYQLEEKKKKICG
jgi:hypothetical protein